MHTYNLKKEDKKRLLVKIVAAIGILILLIFYFNLFFTKGINYDGVFLKKMELSSTEREYTGISAFGDIRIFVKDIDETSNVEVTYNLPNNIVEKYTVEFSESTKVYADKKVVIKKNGEIAFEGDYGADDIFLMNNGAPFLGEDPIITVFTSNSNPYNSKYRISLKNVADIASSSRETIWGRYEILLFAGLLFLITVIDNRFPLLFFRLKHIIDVKDAEPSDLYLSIQKLTWYIYPIACIGAMIYAVIWRFV